MPVHDKDSDCVLDALGYHCVECGVPHGDPCPECGGKAFHTERCPEMLSESDFVEGRVLNSYVNWGF
jgi:hypothetical protein